MTAPAALVVHARIVLRPRVHADRDGDLLAGPAARAAPPVAADEAAHDVRVVLVGARLGLVGRVEGES